MVGEWRHLLAQAQEQLAGMSTGIGFLRRKASAGRSSWRRIAGTPDTPDQAWAKQPASAADSGAVIHGGISEALALAGVAMASAKPLGLRDVLGQSFGIGHRRGVDHLLEARALEQPLDGEFLLF